MRRAPASPLPGPQGQNHYRTSEEMKGTPLRWGRPEQGDRCQRPGCDLAISPAEDWNANGGEIGLKIPDQSDCADSPEAPDYSHGPCLLMSCWFDYRGIRYN